MSANTPTVEPADVEEDLQKWQKKLHDIEDKKDEIDSKIDSVLSELSILNAELLKAKRTLDENTVDKDMEEKRKKNLEIEVRHLVALKALKYKDIRQLQSTLTTLEWKYNEFLEADKKHQEQKAQDLAAIQKSRAQLQLQQVFDTRKLENEARAMQSKFLSAKQELNRQYQRDFETMKQEYELLITDLSNKHKSTMDSINNRLGSKIGELKSDNLRLRREYDAISLEIKVEKEKESRLAKQLERERLISEVNQTNDVSWVNKSDTGINTTRRSALIDMEKVINDLRQRLLEEGDELNVANQQKLATQKALRKAKQDLEEQQILYQRLEGAKKDMERRLNKRLSELQASIEKQAKRVNDEHNTKKAKLLVEYDSKNDEIKWLSKQCTDLQAELARNSSSTSSMAERLEEKLESEREHVRDLESEKRDGEVQVRLKQAEVENQQSKLTEFEQEMKRLLARVEMTRQELLEEEDKNHLLELQIKQLESKV